MNGTGNIPEISSSHLKMLCDRFLENNTIDAKLFDNPNIKRGLRNQDGTGVVAGLTNIGNVHGYLLNEGDRMPIDGELFYRGIRVTDLVDGCTEGNYFGFEETAYLLLFGKLPTKSELSDFMDLLGSLRELPGNFTEDMIIKAPSPDIMNKLARSVLALYSYDDHPDNTSLENVMRQCLELIARFPLIVAHAFQVKKHYYDHESMYLHYPKDNLATAENFLRAIRPSKKYTETEAKLLDISLILHAEHGGGNNSAFACRVLSSSGTDTYSAISAAVGSLKGPKHGGANIKVREMLEYIKKGVTNWKNDDEVASYLEKMVRKEEGDKSGLLYGLGHAIYTKSDPRTTLLKKNALALAEDTGMMDEFLLIDAVERLGPQVLNKVRNESRVLCANVDLYSGFVYQMLGIPGDLYTPIFAISRIVGWAAHRIEEITTSSRIIRPAYKSVSQAKAYTPLADRK